MELKKLVLKDSLRTRCWKKFHDQDPQNSFVDLNRSGVALMEIVGKPDLEISRRSRSVRKKIKIYYEIFEHL